jgi:hypothetical protein
MRPAWTLQNHLKTLTSDKERKDHLENFVTPAEWENPERLDLSLAQKRTTLTERKDNLDEKKAELAKGNPFPLCHWLHGQQAFRVKTGPLEDLVATNKWNETKGSIPFSLWVAVKCMGMIGLAFFICAIFTVLPILIVFGLTDCCLGPPTRQRRVVLKLDDTPVATASRGGRKFRNLNRTAPVE